MDISKHMFNRGRIYYDVMFSGPTYIWYGTYLTNKYLKYFLIIFGILTILLNLGYYLHNIGYSNVFHNILSKSILKKKFEDSNYSDKTQLNRLVLLFIGYPIILYSIKYYPKNAFKFLLYLTVFKIIIGFIYNMYYFIHYIY